MKVELTVLGSGTSSGVPVIGCTCAICQSTHPKNNRLRSSALLSVEGKNIIIDTGPDFRQQCLMHKITKLNAVLYTHAHADHIHGIDDLRLFNLPQNESLPIFASQETLAQLHHMFGYIFNPVTPYKTFVPKLKSFTVTEPFIFEDILITPIPCTHGPQFITTNYRVGNVAWLTDLNGIPEDSLLKLQNLDYLFIDGLRLKSHPTHFSIEEALAAAQKIGAKQTYFIHLAHDYDHETFEKTLPTGFNLAFDGLKVISE